MEQSKVFRKVALDRLSSPEQLDHQIRLIPPVGWIAVAALGVLIAGALFWGFLGSISKKVGGSGVLMYGSGITNVVAQTSGMLTDIGYQAGDYVEKGAVIARVSQDELVKQIEQASNNLLALDSISIESLEFNAENLNYNVYPEFAQLAQQIRIYTAQKEAQTLEYDKNYSDRENQLAQLAKQVETLQTQLRAAREQVEDYRELMKYQRDVQLENAGDATQSAVGLVYSDKSGVYYTRTYKTSQQTTVTDQLGNAYVIFGNAAGFNYPVLFYDTASPPTEQYNPAGTYYLPTYTVSPAVPGASTPTAIKVAKVYYSAGGAAYIDPTGTEFVKSSYTSGDPYDQIEDSPLFDATLASFESQVVSLASQYSQANLQYTQLENGSGAYLKSALIQVEAQLTALTEQFALTKTIKRQDLQKQLEELKDQLSRNGEITATARGTILELNRSRGDYVQVGQSFCSIIKEDGTTQNQEVVLYVSAEQGKKIIKGMKVNVSPSTINQEEYGYIIGIVRSVSDYVVSSDRMMSVLNNQQLVQALSGDSAPLEVNVELLRSSETQSGYEWSTPKGAPMQIDAGTICSGEISVESQRPIDLVIPFLKKLFYSSEGP